MLLLMADEEVGDAGVGSTFFVEELPDLCPHFIIGEGSGERMVTVDGPVYSWTAGSRSSASATLTVRGRAGDASLTDAGSSALTELRRLLDRLADYEPAVRIHPDLLPVLDALGGEGDDAQRLARARAAAPWARQDPRRSDPLSDPSDDARRARPSERHR